MMSSQSWSQFKQKHLTSEDAGWIYAPARDQMQTSSALQLFPHYHGRLDFQPTPPTHCCLFTSVCLSFMPLIVHNCKPTIYFNSNLSEKDALIPLRPVYDESANHIRTVHSLCLPLWKTSPQREAGSGRALMAKVGCSDCKTVEKCCFRSEFPGKRHHKLPWIPQWCVFPFATIGAIISWRWMFLSKGRDITVTLQWRTRQINKGCSTNQNALRFLN